MAQHFVFNGDADGLCALQQLRLEDRSPATLLTGVKRDIDLVRRLNAQRGDDLTVLDLSFDTNAAAVRALLERGVRVRYFDHHYPGQLFEHRDLELHIDTAAAVCTSLIVNRHLKGKRRLWAAVGAFGDNLERPARAALDDSALGESDIGTLRTLGTCLNYNAYGDSESDLLIAPAELHRRLLPLILRENHPFMRYILKRRGVFTSTVERAPAGADALDEEDKREISILLRAMDGPIVRRALRDFTIWPVAT